MGRHRKIILVILIFFPICISAISVSSQQAGTQTDMLYLYNPVNPSYYQDWETVLMQFNYSLQGVTLQEFLSNPQIANDFDLVIVGNSVSDSNGNGISQSDAQIIANTGLPILTTSYGGWIILKLAGYPYGYVSSAIDAIEANDSEVNHTIYETPYNISYIENGDYNEILITDSIFNDIFQLDEAMSSNLTTYGWVMTHAALAKYHGYSNNPDMFFFSFNNASLLNNNGRNLVVNIIEWLLGHSESRSETSLSLELPRTAFPGDTVEIKATLVGTNGTAIENASIQFYVNGTHFEEIQTNASGTAITVWIAPDSLIGNITIHALYLGSQFYLDSTSINYTLSIIKIPTVLEIEISSSTQGQNVSLIVMLSSDRGVNTNSSQTNGKSSNLPIFGALVFLHANDVLIGQAITNESGIAVFIWSNPEQLEGIVRIWAEFPGNQTYSPSISDTFTIELVDSASDNTLLMVSLGASSSFIALGLTLTIARRRIRSIFSN